MDYQPCLHFIGFDDAAQDRLARIFGRPAFVHPSYDGLAAADIAPGDTVVFAKPADWRRYEQRDCLRAQSNERL